MRKLSSEHFIYKMSAENRPVMTVKPGETILIETQDGFGGAIKRDDEPFPTIDLEKVNQTTGPIFIEGAEPGDTLAIDIRNIVLPKHDDFSGFWCIEGAVQHKMA